MKKYTLNGTWSLHGAGYNTNGTIPGSVYSFLLDAKLIDDPFYRDNELKALALMDNEFSFSRKFEYSSKNNRFSLWRPKRVYLLQARMCTLL